ncbi:hypothetical protein EC973_007890 [Apophysomyces ossiformis]|uniref:PH domain-containing protein n=1 Tax=Apophysomyces ossiformis TaxID=679940 RepID=A0A8H7EU00_9FUNG|nr:hypothetical protein EC973_007890 [Apophysomyces ossiformis]
MATTIASPPPRPDKSKLRNPSVSQTPPSSADLFPSSSSTSSSEIPASMLPPPSTSSITTPTTSAMTDEPLSLPLEKIRQRSRFTEHFEQKAQPEWIESLSENDFHVSTRKPAKMMTLRPLGLQQQQHASSTATLETIRALPSSPTTPTGSRRPSLAATSVAISSVKSATPPVVQRPRQFSLVDWPRSTTSSSSINVPMTASFSSSSAKSEANPSTAITTSTSISSPSASVSRPRLGSNASSSNNTTTTTTTSLLPKASPSKVSLFSLNRAEVIIHRLEHWLQLLKAVTSWLDEMSKISLQSSRCYYQRGLPQLTGPITTATEIGSGIGGGGAGLDATNASATVQAGLQVLTMQLAADQQAFGNTLQHTYLPGLLKLRKECKERIRELKTDPSLAMDELLRRAETTRKTMAQLNKCCKSIQEGGSGGGGGQDPWIANLYVLRQLKREVDEENRLRLLMVPIQQETAAFEQRLLDTVKPAIQFCYERLAPGAWDGSADAETAPFKLLMDQIVPDHEWAQFVEHQKKELVNEKNPIKDYLKINYPNKMNPYVMTLYKGPLERQIGGVRKQFSQRIFALTQSGYLHQFRLDDKVSPERSIYIPNTVIVPSMDISHLAAHGPEENDLATAYTFEIRRSATAAFKRDKIYVFRAQSRDELLTWCRLLVDVASRPATQLTQPVTSTLRNPSLDSTSSMEDDERENEERAITPRRRTPSSVAHSSSDGTVEAASPSTPRAATATATTVVTGMVSSTTLETEHHTAPFTAPLSENISKEKEREEEDSSNRLPLLTHLDEDDEDDDTASTTSVITAKFVSEPLPLDGRRISSTSMATTTFDDAESSVYFSSASSPTISRRSSASSSDHSSSAGPIQAMALPGLETSDVSYHHPLSSSPPALSSSSVPLAPSTPVSEKNPQRRRPTYEAELNLAATEMVEENPPLYT